MTLSSEDANAALRKIRLEISEVDALILSNLQKRLDLVKQAGNIKKEAGLPIVVPEVEEEIVLRYRKLAKSENYPTDLVDQVAKSIIRLARHVQGA